ncbi:hypothetical protein RJ640_023827 [Escallonia rubra]|uniref:Peroxin/Ferlin domain-containing protein n=1 Tax=Escallonia rubra TaxID=112253 RepID=A0AA88RSK1_9ASTE|nr:hypothetical protein RJ640_023827 [Escallonia rubra]
MEYSCLNSNYRGLTIGVPTLVEDIHLNVGTGEEIGESIIQNVNGVSIVIQRSLRDLLHQVPNAEVAIEIGELKAALSNREYQIITECALANTSETPNIVPLVNKDIATTSVDTMEPSFPQGSDASRSEVQNGEIWISMKVSVVIGLVELCLHYGTSRDASLATLQVNGVWLVYKSDTQGDGSLSATLKGFTVIDDREGTEQELRLAIRKPDPLEFVTDDVDHNMAEMKVHGNNDALPVPTMLILDVKLSQFSTSVSLCIQRPQLLVALDFLLAVAEFFVPTVSNMLSNEEDERSSHIFDALILDQAIYRQPYSEFSLSPERPLVVDDERVDHYIYDGQGGTLCLRDRRGLNLSSASIEALIYVGSGKELQFKNVTIKNGQYLDLCIELGSNSKYTATEADKVFLEGGDESPPVNTSGVSTENVPSQDTAVGRSTQLILELQREAVALLNFCNDVKAEADLHAIGPELTFFNTSKDVGESLVLSNKLLHAQLDAFCRDKPPTKGVLAVNTSFVRVKRPESFKLVWPIYSAGDILGSEGLVSDNSGTNIMLPEGGESCSIWFPEAPRGYVALGCVVSPGRTQPPLSSAFCIFASLVSPSALRDCIIISSNNQCSRLAFWRVDNCVGTFLPADPTTLSLTGKAYELRHMFFGFHELSSKASQQLDTQGLPSGHDRTVQSERSSTVNSGRRFETIASFRLIWWNQGSGSRKKCSVWRPIVPQGMVYFGDIAVQGYEPPNTCIALHDSENEELFKAPTDFQIVGQIKKHKGVENISFWLPQAPPGFVSLGCVACKGTPKQSDFTSLRCMRSDMVTGDQFLEESIWDTSDAKFTKEPFSIWAVGNELGTFVVRSGFKKPPRRFAVKLADPNIPSGSDNTAIDAEIKTFSAALFDDYGGLMVPLFNVTLSSIGFSLHGKPDYLSSTISFSLAARSYNDKYESWEPLVEPVDGVLRYQYDINAPGAASQLRLTSTRDLNLNVTVSNANMAFQAYASWDNLSHAHESDRNNEAVSPSHGGRPIIDIHHRRNYFVSPQNKLGQDIFIRATEIRGLPNIIKMPSGEMKPLKVPVSKNMLNAHFKGDLCRKVRMMATIIIAEAEGSLEQNSDIWNDAEQLFKPYNIACQRIPRVQGVSSHQYAVAVFLTPNQSLSGGLHLNQQSAHTCGRSSDKPAVADLELVKWNELFFFSIDSLDYYTVEFIVTDLGKDGHVGYVSAPLKQIARAQDNSSSYRFSSYLDWIEFSSTESMKMTQEEKVKRPHGRIRFAVLLPPNSDVKNNEQDFIGGRKSGFIQISPTKEGPWTTVRLNYSAPAACWRLGNDVVASELSVKDGNKYVTIRSLVSVRNYTDVTLDVCLKLKASNESARAPNDVSKELQVGGNEFETEEFFETESYNPTIGWVSTVVQPVPGTFEHGGPHQGAFGVDLPSGWEWIDDWHLDRTSVKTADGWVYAPDFESLKWPESYNPLKHVNYARQRRWIRNRKQASGDLMHHIFVGQLKPEETIPLPLPGLSQSRGYILQLRPSNMINPNEYSWSSVTERPGQSDGIGRPKQNSEICLSSLTEGEELLYCSKGSESSSNSSHGMWYCLTIKAREIAKDIHSDPIQDWILAVKSPLSIINYLPLTAEFSVFEKQASGHFLACTRGLFSPGETVKIFNGDVRNPLYLSLLPQRGWLPIHEAVLISHPSRVPAKSTSLRSSVSGRIVQIILEQNHNEERPPFAKIVRIYSPYWFAIARCPPLTFRLLDMSGRKATRKISLPLMSRKQNDVVFEEITDEEIHEGCTVASALNFKALGISASIIESGKEHFGPPKELSPLGDMDGSLDLCAYDADGNCLLLFISSKPCPYQSVPTKVITVRPFMTFTNRLGEDIFVKFNSEDQPKVLRASDVRVSFVYREADGPNKLQACGPLTFFFKWACDCRLLESSMLKSVIGEEEKVRLQDTEWSFPVQIVKEDTISLVVKRHDTTRKVLRTEVRGYEEGSRFIVVFRIGSRHGPVRIENRTRSKTIRVRQSGFGDDAWILLEPHSTTNFCWEDPYGQKLLDAEVCSNSTIAVCKLDLAKSDFQSVGEGGLGFLFHVLEIGDIKVARFIDDRTSGLSSNGGIRFLSPVGNWRNSDLQENTIPLELSVELGVVGVSLVDHRPKELSYLYLERVFISYSTGYDGGTTSRFKLILGQLQLDNQLPLTSMHVLLAPEQASDMHLPVFKMTITICNKNPDGIQIYPYVYIRMSAFVLLALRHDHMSIFFSLIDVSEVRLKLSLETAPAQRPHGVLGVWSPILSAVGNAFKIQVHLRKVMLRDRFMRKSSVVPAITNRIWRDLIHNPLHLIFSVDVLGMTSSTLASLGKGFAELSTDGQFLQLRSKQVSSRKITGLGDGIMQGTEALAQGFAFGVSGVVTKPVESARQNGLLGLAHGLGQAFLGFVVQPMSGALDFFSLTVDGIGASCSRCLEVLNNKTTFERIRNPRAIRADNVLREYCEREAVGQMILYLAEASRHFGCTEIFKEPSKFAWSDYYEDHFVVPYERIVLCLAPDKMDKKPCKIMWDVPWEELMALELAKAGQLRPSHVILHLRDFRRSEPFVRVIKCSAEEEPAEEETQAVRICSVPSSQRHVCFAWSEADRRELLNHSKAIIKSSDLSTSGSVSDKGRFLKHSINFLKVWRNCTDDYKTPVSIWHPRAPEGYVSLGCVAVPSFTEPEPSTVYCVAESLAEETIFEEQKVWSAPDSYPWACHIYQVRSDALHFVALRQPKEESEWKPMGVLDDSRQFGQSSEAHSFDSMAGYKLKISSFWPHWALFIIYELLGILHGLG